MSGNYHVQFLGGNGAVKPLTYPVTPFFRLHEEKKERRKKNKKMKV
jgi:hypothetical protein